MFFYKGGRMYPPVYIVNHMGVGGPVILNMGPPPSHIFLFRPPMLGSQACQVLVYWPSPAGAPASNK